jgi:hypothetical protein
MTLEIIGYYWDGATSWTIYQKPNGSTVMKKNETIKNVFIVIKKNYIQKNFFIGLLRKKEETIVKNALISWEHVKSVGVLTLKKVEKNTKKVLLNLDLNIIIQNEVIL